MSKTTPICNLNFDITALPYARLCENEYYFITMGGFRLKTRFSGEIRDLESIYSLLMTRFNHSTVIPDRGGRVLNYKASSVHILAGWPRYVKI